LFSRFSRKTEQAVRNQSVSWGKVEIDHWGLIEISTIRWVVVQDARAYWYNEIVAWKHDEREVEHPETKRSAEIKAEAKWVADRPFAREQCGVRVVVVVVEIGRGGRVRVRGWVIRMIGL
jgi:hypothetical protein